MTFTENLYQKITELRSQNLKVLVTLGGWVDSTPKYSRMMADPNLRANIVQQTTDYVIKYGFDGLDVAIDFPNAYQVSQKTEHLSKNSSHRITNENVIT